jgi:two-component system KDP operon response regulator KdpE
MTELPQHGTVLVIDDEPQIHRFLTPALTAAGYAPLRAETAAAALHLAATRAPDILLLDLGLPDMDGQTLLVRLRSFLEIPIIVLSARDREADKIAALDAGADDYLEKPFGLGELLARLRTAQRHRRRQTNTDEPVVIGALRIDHAAHRVTLADAPVALTRREIALLLLLARTPGRTLTHRQLLTALWGPAHAQDTQYLRVAVSQLRQKLGAYGARIATEPGVGYRFDIAGGAAGAPA